MEGVGVDVEEEAGNDSFCIFVAEMYPLWSF